MNVLGTYRFMQEIEEAMTSLFDKELPFKPDYVIAGGAVRDTLLGRPVADIDVCIDSPDDWKGSIGEWVRYGTGDFQYDEGCVEYLCNTTLKVRGHSVQLIGRTTGIGTTQLTNYHAVGLSNCYWFNGQLALDKSFLLDVQDEIISINRGRWSESSLARYVEKVRKKYPWKTRFAE